MHFVVPGNFSTHIAGGGVTVQAIPSIYTFFSHLAVVVWGHALSTYAKRGRGGVLPLRTPLHKCDVTYVVSPAYKGGEGVKKS